jgi:hypothetical protein
VGIKCGLKTVKFTKGTQNRSPAPSVRLSGTQPVIYLRA